MAWWGYYYAWSFHTANFRYPSLLITFLNKLLLFNKHFDVYYVKQIKNVLPFGLISIGSPSSANMSFVVHKPDLAPNPSQPQHLALVQKPNVPHQCPHVHLTQLRIPQITPHFRILRSCANCIPHFVRSTNANSYDAVSSCVLSGTPQQLVPVGSPGFGCSIQRY